MGKVIIILIILLITVILYVNGVKNNFKTKCEQQNGIVVNDMHRKPLCIKAEIIEIEEEQ